MWSNVSSAVNIDISIDISSNISSTGHNSTLSANSASIQQVLSVALGTALVLVVFCMGCAVEVSKAWAHVQRPTGVLVGLLCQFGVMPLTAYLLALGLDVTPMQAVAVITLGSSPGGIISNIITYWLDGDMDLSITMTSISTLLGFGAMPLSLYIYTRGWVQAGTIQVPYLSLGITFIILIVPVTCGIVLNWKWPKVARIILKIGSLVGGLLIIGLSVASVLLWDVKWNMSTPLVIIGGVFPITGYLVGFIIAAALRQPWNRCRTIAMETGAQNINICSTVLQLFFTLEQFAEVIMLPIVYAYVQLFGGLLMVIVFQTYKKVSCKMYSVNLVEKQSQSFPNVQCWRGEINSAFRDDVSHEPTQSSGRHDLEEKR